jgi:hypothetical protein
VHGEDGQAAVEWVALVLAAALALGALAAVAPSGSTDRELGKLVAKRITGAPRASAPRPSARPSPPHAATPRAVDAFRSLRGLSAVAKRAWIFCLGYRRWRYELEHPMAPNEILPLREALDVANTCLNPYDYLVED